MRNENPTVYSTEWDQVCLKCKKPLQKCSCRIHVQPKGDGVVRIQRESKGRNGKTVTIISGILEQNETLRDLLSDLKRICGSGGTLKDGVIEIQGDHREKLLEELKKRGYKTKIAGG